MTEWVAFGPSAHDLRPYGWRRGLVAKCQQVPLNTYQRPIRSPLRARGTERKMRSVLWLTCQRGKDYEMGWLYRWKGEMRAKERGKAGWEERFPELIKCSEGRKLPASIPAPLDKLVNCSLLFLCSAEVAGWGHHQEWGGMVGAINSKCFCARRLLVIRWSCLVDDSCLHLDAGAAYCHLSVSATLSIKRSVSSSHSVIPF